MTNVFLKHKRSLLLFFFSLLFLGVPLGWSQSVLVLTYHRFGNELFPSTNIRMDQFEEHIKKLKSKNYEFLKASEIPDRLQLEESEHPLVAITIDDAFQSLYTNAWPILKKHQIPFTVFVSSQKIDDKRPAYLTWDQLHEMMKDGLMEVGGHTKDHENLATLSESEAVDQIQKNKEKITEKLGIIPTSFSYPYGAASNAIIANMEKFGYTIAFGQHSGFVSESGSLFYAPRFPLNEEYGTAERFNDIVSYKPLEVELDPPYNPLVAQDTESISIPFFWKIPVNMDVQCYRSDALPSDVMWKDDKTMLLHIKKLQDGFTRVNCTYQDKHGQWYWYGMQWYALEDKSRMSQRAMQVFMQLT